MSKPTVSAHRPNLARAAEMVEHGVIRAEDACTGKQAFASKNDARHHAKHVAKRTGRDASYYRCAFCGQYHITKFRHGEDAA